LNQEQATLQEELAEEKFMSQEAEEVIFFSFAYYFVV